MRLLLHGARQGALDGGAPDLAPDELQDVEGQFAAAVTVLGRVTVLGALRA